MIINLERLNSRMEDEIVLKQSVDIPSSLVSKSPIISLENVFFEGLLAREAGDELFLRGILSGNMHLEDSISLEDVIYEFSISLEEKIEENSEKDQISIDIIDILWQNIVLEIPLRYTKIEDLSQYSGDGWKLIGEEEKYYRNPFQKLKEKYKEE